MHRLYKEPTLFIVVLGGRTKTSHIELHDVRWVIGRSIKDTFPKLRAEWIGDINGLHIDSYIAISYINGYEIITKKSESVKQHNVTKNKLWFVNLGGYNPNKLSEEHEFGLFVAETSQSAKSLARKSLLKKTLMKHKDDLKGISKIQRIDDCSSIQKLGTWEISLIEDPLKRNQEIKPDWYGYLRIDLNNPTEIQENPES